MHCTVNVDQFETTRYRKLTAALTLCAMTSLALRQALDALHRLQQQTDQLTAHHTRAAEAEAAAAAAAGEAAAWEARFMRERVVRRALHEQLQVLRGNIRVLVRVRPSLQLLPVPLARPSGAGALLRNPGTAVSCISFPLEGALAVVDAASGRAREFEFDAVFAPGATQQQARLLVAQHAQHAAS
jgi:kinesin family protein C2/C3